MSTHLAIVHAFIIKIGIERRSLSLPLKGVSCPVFLAL